MTNDSTDASDPISAPAEVPPLETPVEGEVLPSGPQGEGLPESEHSAAEHAFPTDRPLEKWINEAHG